MDEPTVTPSRSRRPGGQKVNAYFPDGSSTTIVMLDLEPRHDAEHGTFYVAADGSKWQALHGLRGLNDGGIAGGPGWFQAFPEGVAIED